MHKVIVRNLNQSTFPTLQAQYCDTFLCRLRGLTFRRSLPDDEGLLLVQGRESRLDAAIHMLFMWMDIAVVWLNDQKRVVDICLARRWRPIYVPQAPASYVLELSPAWQGNFAVGDQIDFEETSAS
ncbi:MAG: DUF192 domain-containing protein [Anaerolineales bacterium]|nr:DUF192 domain-containing protein [Anaerolineales bacterium]